jgi:prephenate dehydrogenase
MEARGTARRVEIVGTGLIGASIGLSLRAGGWWVTGRDKDPERAGEALELGAIDEVGEDTGAEIVFVATPLESVADEATSLLADPRRPGPIVTDVAGVKSRVARSIEDPRFVGGHPMAGSEQVGVDGASSELFLGATWVLTPTENTDPGAFTALRGVVGAMGAEVVALSPEQHDLLVAVVSHVPHLTAATLMNLAERRSEQHAALLRLAAGGFRDMTRVAAGQPAIWPDVCAANSAAIVETLDALVSDLTDMRERVANCDRTSIFLTLENAARARRSLPKGAVRPERLAELRVPVPDRPGVLAEITTLAGDMGVNIYDLEIAHSTEGDRGVLVLVVDAGQEDRLSEVLSSRGYRSTSARLE